MVPWLDIVESLMLLLDSCLQEAQNVVSGSVSSTFLPSCLPTRERTVTTAFLLEKPLFCHVPSTETRMFFDFLADSIS